MAMDEISLRAKQEAIRQGANPAALENIEDAFRIIRRSFPNQQPSLEALGLQVAEVSRLKSACLTEVLKHPEKYCTKEAQEVLTAADEESRRFNHPYIGTEHLLLGLIRSGARDKIFTHGNPYPPELSKARSTVEFIIGRGDSPVVGRTDMTPRAKKVIELSIDESRRFNQPLITPEMLLLGIIREGEGIAAGVLESLNYNLEGIRSNIVDSLRKPQTQS